MSKYFHFLNQILRLPTKWDVNKLKCNISKSRGVDCPNSTRKTSPNPHGNSPTVSPHIHNNFCPLSAPTLITFEYSISISSCVLGFWLVLNQVATPWSMEIRCSTALAPPNLHAMIRISNCLLAVAPTMILLSFRLVTYHSSACPVRGQKAQWTAPFCRGASDLRGVR
jgi:hypothetical protein